MQFPSYLYDNEKETGEYDDKKCHLIRDFNYHKLRAPNRNRAQILKHLVEAEKSTFQGELSFQRSECTAVARIICVDYKQYFV